MITPFSPSDLQNVKNVFKEQLGPNHVSLQWLADYIGIRETNGDVILNKFAEKGKLNHIPALLIELGSTSVYLRLPNHLKAIDPQITNQINEHPSTLKHKLFKQLDSNKIKTIYEISQYKTQPELSSTFQFLEYLDFLELKTKTENERKGTQYSPSTILTGILSDPLVGCAAAVNLVSSRLFNYHPRPSQNLPPPLLCSALPAPKTTSKQSNDDELPPDFPPVIPAPQNEITLNPLIGVEKVGIDYLALNEVERKKQFVRFSLILIDHITNEMMARFCVLHHIPAGISQEAQKNPSAFRELLINRGFLSDSPETIKKFLVSLRNYSPIEAASYPPLQNHSTVGKIEELVEQFIQGRIPYVKLKLLLIEHIDDDLANKLVIKLSIPPGTAEELLKKKNRLFDYFENHFYENSGTTIFSQHPDALRRFVSFCK